MAKFKKIPVVIEAIQWTGDNLYEITSFIDGVVPDTNSLYSGMMWEQYCDVVKKTSLTIHTLEGEMRANVNDWIIKGVHGEFYPCKPDIFLKTYEKHFD